MRTLTREDRQILRHIVLSVLAIRVGSAFTARQVQTKAAMETPFVISEEDVAEALKFHEALTPPNVRSEHDAYGTTVYFYATAAGVLAAEREQAKQA